jgi:hypothetical protein
MAAGLALVMIVLAVVTIVTYRPAPAVLPPPAVTSEPVPVPDLASVNEPLLPGQVPGDLGANAVPSPAELQAQGQKDWPDAAYGLWQECADLLSRKQFVQAVGRMRDVAARATDGGVRAVAVTCAANARVSNGDFEEALPELEEAKKLADQLPPVARAELKVVAGTGRMTALVVVGDPDPVPPAPGAPPGGTSSRSDRSVSAERDELRAAVDALSVGGVPTVNFEARIANLAVVGLRFCLAAPGRADCPARAVSAAGALRGPARETLVTAFTSVPAAGAAPTTTTEPPPATTADPAAGLSTTDTATSEAATSDTSTSDTSTSDTADESSGNGGTTDEQTTDEQTTDEQTTEESSDQSSEATDPPNTDGGGGGDGNGGN